MKRSLFRQAALGAWLAAGLLACSAWSGAAQAATLRIGVVPGVFADTVKLAAKEAQREGLDIKVIEFTDWTTPNIALNAGDIDLNYFQNQEFLANANAAQKFDLKPVAPGILSYIGLYSKRYKRAADLPNGALVAIASDPVNQGRGLRLLDRVGLIQLKPQAGLLAKLSDIAANPKQLKFKEVDGPHLVQATADVDLAQGYPYFIIAAKAFDPSSALVLSHGESDRFAIHFVARADKAANPDIHRFVAIYQQSPTVRAYIDRFYGGDKRLYRLAWLPADPAVAGGESAQVSTAAIAKSTH
jgi:D-methionine transport system substrate-binding protein